MGKKLGIKSRVSDEATKKKLEAMERRDKERGRSRKRLRREVKMCLNEDVKFQY